MGSGVSKAQLADAEERIQKEKARADRAEAELARLRAQLTPSAQGNAPHNSVASEPHQAELPSPEELPTLEKWNHPTDGGQPIESFSRCTADEFRSNMDALAAKVCAADEKLACHFTSKASARRILADKSHGLLASTVGQLGGGVSLCLPLPPAMHWEPNGRGPFRPTTGRALWGEKAADVRLGGPDDDKLDVNCSTCCSSSR